MADLCDIFQTRGGTDEIGIETDRKIIATDESNDECLQNCGIEVTLSSVEHGRLIGTTTSIETPIDTQQRVGSGVMTTLSKSSTDLTASTHSDPGSSSTSINNEVEDNNGIIDSRAGELSLAQRYAQSIARSPTKHLSIAIIVSIVITVIVILFGNVKIQVGNKGWKTRGTVIADRSTQQLLLRGITKHNTVVSDDEPSSSYCDGSWYGSEEMVNPREINLNMIWKTTDADATSPTVSALDADALHEMCLVEENTLGVLEELDVCHQCPIDETDGSAQMKCLQPYSLVTAARLYLNLLEGITQPEYLVPSISCDELRTRWGISVQEQFTAILTGCTKYMLQKAKIEELEDGEYSSCPLPIMTATLVDKDFLQTDLVRFTSSIYATKSDTSSVKSMYAADRAGQFLVSCEKDSSFDGEYIELGVNSLYSTGRQGFYELYLNEILPNEAAISVAAVIVTSLCVLFHTKSPFLTLLGLMQIVLALPVAYFVYYFICRLSFFPFVNINALFIVFALGADDIFVVVDKWKLNRRLYPGLTTEQVAVVALPDAAKAIFVTSITTSVAFFASAVIKVPSVSLFSIYCGLVVALDYVLCILLIFPALCLYDKWLKDGPNSVWLSFTFKRNKKGGGEQDGGGEIKQPNETPSSWTNRILTFHYNVIHILRWPLLVVSVGVIIVCSFVAVTLAPPDSPDQPFLPPENPYEIHRIWHRQLLATTMSKGNVGLVNFIWGLVPSDTGHHLNPDDRSQLVYDSTFQPGMAQSYLIDMCHTIENMMRAPEDNYTCIMQHFNSWLQEQSQSNTQTLEYSANCKGADSIPMDQEVFESCLIEYSNMTGNADITYESGKVKVFTIRARTNTTMWSPFEEQSQEWHDMESWYSEVRKNSPEEANFFFTSQDFWAYDTYRNSISSAFISALIAMCCASIMILLTSHSILVMLFSAVSIGYVLVASTASLVSLGWTIGMFESILFGILIGLGCDYVLHFGYAYTRDGKELCLSKEVRTKRALLDMGPSVFASAFTTLSTALMMLAAENMFIHKFAMMLVMVVIHSSIGSFIVFMVLCDCFGPSDCSTKRLSCIKARS